MFVADQLSLQVACVAEMQASRRRGRPIQSKLKFVVSDCWAETAVLVFESKLCDEAESAAHAVLFAAYVDATQASEACNSFANCNCKYASPLQLSVCATDSGKRSEQN